MIQITEERDKKKYDYLIVGAGLFGTVFAREAALAGRKSLIIDRRSHLAGNVYTEEKNGIQVHVYGAHIFHTGNKRVWDYVNQFTEFNRYTNSPVARYKDELYNLPFNMNTFHALWGVRTPAEAKAMIESQTRKAREEIADPEHPANVEEQALLLAGRDIYEKLVKGYTEKQWGRKATELPAFIIKRLPFRFTYDNNYFNDKYQGIPVGGYTRMVERIISDGIPEGMIEVRLGTDFFEEKERLLALCDKVVYTGPLDEYFDRKLGALEFRSLRFETEYLEDEDNYQGNAVVNYTEYEVPFTRIIEHKHFEFGTGKGTVITREYPAAWQPGDEPYYPVNDERNNTLCEKYKELAAREDVIFGGRLGQYRYYDMHQVVESALDAAEKELKGVSR